MISNDRIQLNTANQLLAQRTPATGKIQDMNALTEHAAIAAADTHQVSTCNAPDITLRDRLIEAGTLIGASEDSMYGRGHVFHFGEIRKIAQADSKVPHTACVGFGMERTTLALFRHHGPDAKAWPANVREFPWGDTQSHINAGLEVLS